MATLLSAKYSRSSMDKIMAELLGGWTFKSVYPHELLVVAYEYNQQEPRFFSKYFNYLDSGNYNVTVGQATGASAAAPTFFDP